MVAKTPTLTVSSIHSNQSSFLANKRDVKTR